MNWRKTRKWIKDAILLVLGCFTYAIAVQVFLSPLKISPGGITGIATALNFLTDFPTGVYLVIFNLPIVLLGLIKFGKLFILKTAVTVVLSSFFVEVIANFYEPVYIDVMLGSLFGGALMGASLGFVMLAGATTGGVDIIVKLLNGKFNISMGRAFLFIDGAVIIFASIAYRDFESALYSVVAIFISSKMVDLVLCGTLDSKAIFIITDNEEVIKRGISESVDRGVTILRSVGGYTGKNNNILLCVARNNEISTVRKLVTELDSKAFFFIVNAGDVVGKGFK